MTRLTRTFVVIVLMVQLLAATDSKRITIPAFASPVSPTPRLYTFSRESQFLNVIDQNAASVIASIDVGFDVRAVALTHDGAVAYVLSRRSSAGQWRVAQLDLTTQSIVLSADIAGQGIHAVLSPDGERLYVSHLTANNASGVISVIDAGTLTTSQSVQQPSFGNELSISPDGRWVFMDRTIIEAATLQEVATLEIDEAFRPAFTPAGTRAYLSVRTGKVVVVDTSSLKITGAAVLPPVNDVLGPAALNSDGSLGYVLGSTTLGVRLYEFDTRSLTVTRSVALTGFPYRLTVSKDDNWLWVSDRANQVIRRIDAASLSTSVDVALPGSSPGQRSANAIASPLPQVDLALDAASTYYGKTLVIAARLTSANGPAPGRAISFSVFGQPGATAVTNTGGVASASISLVGTNAGNYPGAVSASFAGDGQIPAMTRTTALDVYRSPPDIVWNPAPLAAGVPVGAAQVNASANVPGAFAYTPPSGTVLSVGVHMLSATFTPADPANYSSVSSERLLTVFSGNAQSTLRLDHETGIVHSGVTFGRWVFNPATSLLYAVELHGDSPHVGKVAVINTVTQQIVSIIDVPPGSNGRLAADFGRRRLYAIGSSGLAIVNLDTGNVAELVPFPIGVSCDSAAVNPASGELFLVGVGGPAITAFDPTRSASDPQRFRQFFPGGFYGGDNGATYPPAVNAETSLLYVTREQHRSDVARTATDVIDVDPARATYGQIVATIPETQGPYVIDRSRRLVYGATRWDISLFNPAVPASVSVIDADPGSATAHTVVARIEVPYPAPMFVVSLTLNPARDLLYVLLGQSNTAIDQGGPDSKSAVASIQVSARATRSVYPLEHKRGVGSNLSNFSFGGWTTPIFVDPTANLVFAIGAWTAVFSDPQPSQAAVPASGAAPAVTVGTVTLDFDQVTSSGVVNVELIDAATANLTLPGQFAIDGGVAFDITSTASVSGPTTICFDMSAVTDPDAFAALRILHGENGAWVDRTVSSDFQTGQVCASVSSLSPFVVARLDATYQTTVLFDASKAFKSGSTIPIKVRLLSTGGQNASSPLVTLNAKRLRHESSNATFAVQDAGHANADRNFRYDAALGGYIYNLSTKGLAAGTYTLTFTAAGDASYHALQFQVR